MTRRPAEPMPPPGRLNLPRLKRPTWLQRCRWCGGQLLVNRKQAQTCPTCDAPDTTSADPFSTKEGTA